MPMRVLSSPFSLVLGGAAIFGLVLAISGGSESVSYRACKAGVSHVGVSEAVRKLLTIVFGIRKLTPCCWLIFANAIPTRLPALSNAGPPELPLCIYQSIHTLISWPGMLSGTWLMGWSEKVGRSSILETTPLLTAMLVPPKG